MNNSHPSNISTNSSVSATSRGTVQIVVESFIFLVLNIATLVGNVLVCLAWYKKPSLRTVTNIFILSLALADLLKAVLVMPLPTASSIANKWIGGYHGYAMWGFGGHILSGISLLTLMLLAVNRYFRVVKPARYPNIFTKKRSKAMAVSAWIVSIVLACVYPLIGIQFSINPVNPILVIPSFPNTSAVMFYRSMQITYLTVPSTIIAACYVRIYQTIRQHNAAAAPSSQGGRSAYGVEEAKMTRLLTSVLVGFYICWLPPLIAVILDTLKVIGETDQIYFGFYNTFPVYTSSVINPIIYATMSQSFRKEFRKILCEL